MIKIITFDEKSIDRKTELRKNEAHVWLIHWRIIKQWVLKNWSVMDTDDKTAVMRYQFTDDRLRSAAGRILSRILLAEYSGLPLNSIRIIREKYGKPVMDSEIGKIIKHSISHSGEVVALAFSREGRIGIDVEEKRDIPEYRELARNFFTAGESNKIIISENNDLFYKYWTAKEAYTKALGTGLSKSLKSFYIEGTTIFDHKISQKDWEIFSVDRAEGYCVSVAVEKKGEKDAANEKIPERLQ